MKAVQVENKVEATRAVDAQPTTLRIAIVTSIHPDFDSRLWKYARCLAQIGVEVHFVAPWKVTGEVDGVQFHPFTRVEKRSERFRIPARILRKLRPLLRRVNLIHFHDIDILPYMSLLSFFKPVIYDIHENYPEEMLVRQWIPRRLRKLAFHVVRTGQWVCARKIGNVVLVAPSQEKDLPMKKLRSMYVWNYASEQLADEAADDYLARPDTVIFTGSQHPANGSSLFLEIASLVSQQRSGTRFLCFDRFASAAFREEFMNKIRQLGLQDVVKVEPNCKPHELIRYLNQSKVAISANLRIPQQIDGIHTKLFEYLAVGIPIVVSDLPHQVDLVQKYECGVLAQPEDPQTFASAIIRLLDNGPNAMRLGRNGQMAFRSHLSWESQMPGVVDFYHSVLRGGGHAKTV
ncbi:MAG TPA: glycosyltransferase family 4 protein [Candidatus Koribacter sp.]|jgi:glycosyltransferase involved in cell wall biosynthesis